ncbi:RNA polymerase sigma factor [Planctomycetes bacterium Poly30]|uniref:RNA polymerase sigma factor n=2 Tax=Saltatorellus ferox TaxID=2528018 RepID=A0A518F036_9BACT|nr:RNA polymerase sigma factor [Planctomycetes bacterium Poly30]
MEQAEGRLRLASAVDQLPENQREALRLKFESGLSYAEIAAVLGSTEGTVGWWLHAAVKTLRERLGKALEDGAVASSIGGGEA